jgi:hypothetical protein
MRKPTICSQKGTLTFFSSFVFDIFNQDNPFFTDGIKIQNKNHAIMITTITPLIT